MPLPHPPLLLHMNLPFLSDEPGLLALLSLAIPSDLAGLSQAPTRGQEHLFGDAGRNGWNPSQPRIPEKTEGTRRILLGVCSALVVSG